MCLQNLSTDILWYLKDFLPTHTLKALRLTNIFFSHVFASEVLRHIYLNIGRTPAHLAGMQAMMNWLQQKLILSAPITSIKTLRVISPKPRPKVTTVMTDVEEEQLIDHIAKGIMGLYSVHTVMWDPVSGDTQRLQMAVASAISRLPQLRNLSVSIYHYEPIIPLRSIRDLNSIQIHYKDTYLPVQFETGTVTTSVTRSQALEVVAQILINSPSIDSLLYSGTPELNEKHSLEEILQVCNDAGVSLPLKCIALSCPSRAAVRVIPHSQHLTALSVRCLGETPELLESLEPLWSYLKDQNVRLRYITVDYVSPGLRNYLEHYSGLESFDLFEIAPLHMPGETKLDEAFYKECLKGHKETLKSFHVHARKWSYSKSELNFVLSGCRHLEHLQLPVGSYSLDPDSSTNPAQHRKSILRATLDTVMTRFPAIKSVFLFVALEDGTGEESCEAIGGVDENIKMIWSLIKKEMVDYIAPDSGMLTFLPRIQISFRERALLRRSYAVICSFFPFFVPEEGRFRYQ